MSWWRRPHFQIILQAKNGTEWQKQDTINTYVIRPLESNKFRVTAHETQVFGCVTTLIRHN